MMISLICAAEKYLSANDRKTNDALSWCPVAKYDVTCGQNEDITRVEWCDQTDDINVDVDK